MASVGLCQHCKQQLSPVRLRRRAKYCSYVCDRADQRAKYRTKNPKSTLSAPTTGAISELLVSADLLSKGYEVFRALSPACSCDLAVLSKGKQLLRIEVRTAHLSPGGKTVYCTKGTDVGKSDVTAVVTGRKEGALNIEYRPPLESFTV